MGILIKLIVTAAAVLAAANPALAQDGESVILNSDGLAAIGIGIAALGGALGQGKVISGALDSIARNPGAAGQMRGPWFLGLVFIESLVIYAWLVALRIIGFI